MAERQRLDREIETRGLLPSRARARDAVLRGTVTVNGEVATKPHQMVGPTDKIVLDDPAGRYVSRAALKLSAGLDGGGIDVAGKVCLDVGASTGGFAQVLVERGAAKVYAVDVGHGQLHPSISALPQIVAMEGVNAKDLTREMIAEPVSLLVCDISFVSVTKVLAAPLALCAPDAEAVVLFKPQFEAGREHVGKGGIVRDESAIAAALESVIQFMTEQGFSLCASIPSPIEGGDGNKETVAVFRRIS
jgi:23S rRNA (cytidine1920-2'-O)/16S rRNA (cytidine1409-2'-O)-methyltransferase